MADCIFCKIISKEIPSKVVYEDEHSLAFLDINPANKGHCLVISKHHAATIYDVPEEHLRNLIATVKKVALAVKKAVNPQGMNILQNNEKASGQIVDHIHFHVIPRNFEDGNNLHFVRVDMHDEDQKKIAKHIRESIESSHEKPNEESKVNQMLDNIDKNLKDLDNVLK